MKRCLKFVCRLLITVAVAPLILYYKAFSLNGPNDALFGGIGQLLALAPGRSGSFLRVAFYSWTACRVSSDIHIDFGSFLSHPEVTIEDGVYIGAYCIVGKCLVGRGTLIGSCVNVLSGSRQHAVDGSEVTMEFRGGTFVRIEIGEHCWIGNGAILMTDVADRCVIGAGSVVVKPIPSNSIAVGNPCRVVRDRREMTS